jgi:hypothetical protein
MAITKYIQKNTHLDAVVKVVNEGGGASTTIGLLTDLLKNNETQRPGVTPRVNVSSMELSIAAGSKLTISRGGVTTTMLFSETESLTNEFSADSQGNDQDIVVTFTGEGMLSLRLLKVAGYMPNFRPEQGIS